MKDWTKRFSLAALTGFLLFVLALPVSCCGFVIYNEHLYGEVQSRGPEAILKASGLSAVLGFLVAAIVWRKSRAR